jgi:PKD repeat protein
MRFPSFIAAPTFALAGMATAVDFPGTAPGAATARTESSVHTVSNQVIGASFKVQGGQLVLDSIKDKVSGKNYPQSVVSPVFKMKTSSAGLLSDWVVTSGPALADAVVDANSASKGKHVPGKVIKATLASMSGGVIANWQAELRDGSGYIRTVVDFQGNGSASGSFTEIEMLCDLQIDPAGAQKVGSQDGAVLRSGGMFFGVEMPFYWNNLTNNRIRGGITTTLSLAPDKRYEFSAVMGVYPNGQLRRAFLHYNDRERARSYKPLLHYNCWFDLERRVSATGMIGRIDEIEEQLHTQRGVAVDSYVIDDGYDDYSAATGGFWAYDGTKFPNGFTPVADRLKDVGSNLGIWISPGGGYGSVAERAERAKEDLGLNSFSWDLTIPEYYTWWHDRHVSHVQNDRANYFKWDQLGTSASGHFMRLMQVARVMRGINPDVFVNTTVGTWQSPFWLNQIDCTWRGGNDMGYEGDGDERERWNTYRDRVSWDKIAETEHIYPLNALMNHGIVFANGHPFAAQAYNGGTKDLRNEVRSFFGGGYALQELYLTPSLLGPSQWDAIAEGARWARNKANILVDAHFIGPSPASNQVYGFAAWQNNTGAITLRNPSSVVKTYDLDVGTAFELPAGVPQAYVLQAPYGDQRIQTLSTLAGRITSIELQPYEVLVFDATVDTSSVHAVLEISEPKGIAPQTILFNVSNSLSASSITRYELDANGDETIDSTSSGLSMFTFTDPGTYTAELTVFDSGTGFDTITRTFEILAVAPSATMVPINHVTSSSVPSSGTSLMSMMNGSGLAEPLTAANRLTITHTGGLNLSHQYLSDNTHGETFTFYFSGQSISEILIWNYSQNDARGLDAITAVEIDRGSGFVDQNLSLTLQTAIAAGNKAQVLSLGKTLSGVVAIRITVAQAETGPGETAGGINEVAFASHTVARNPFAEWANGYGLSADPTANDDSDGLNNFTEYALGLDPTLNDAERAITLAGAGVGDLKYRFLSAVSKVNFTVETSADLERWSPYNGALVIDGTHYQIDVPVNPESPGNVSRFLRLRFSE